MYYKFYIDIFFFENMILDYLVLCLTGHILKRKRNGKRLWAAAFAGTLGACVFWLTPLRKIPAVIFFGEGILALLMVRIGFAVSEKNVLKKSLTCLWGTALLLGGMLQALAAQVKLPVILLAILAAMLFYWLQQGYQKAKFRVQNDYEVVVRRCGKTICIRGFKDTGNHLKDPLTGKPVSILSYEAAKELLDEEVKIFYIPYHSIGKSSGLLPGMVADDMSIRGEEGSQWVKKPVIAISREPVSGEGTYQMILHPMLVEN